MAFELGNRLVEARIFHQSDDIFFLMADELQVAVHAYGNGDTNVDFAALAAARRELREARKPPPAGHIAAGGKRARCSIF